MNIVIGSKYSIEIVLCNGLPCRKLKHNVVFWEYQKLDFGLTM